MYVPGRGWNTSPSGHDKLQELGRDYGAGFLRYLPRHDEAPLNVGYEIGRAAVVSGLSLLEPVQIHHEVPLEVLATHPATTWRNRT